MAFFTDQLLRQIDLPGIPKRIISLVPSQTELLFDFGLDEEVAGITKFCVHPDAWFRKKLRVGGTKTLNFEKIRSVNPDLVIANKEENVKEQLEELMNDFPVWISDIKNLEDALQMISSVGEMTGKAKRAEDISIKIRSGFSSLSKKIISRKSAVYLIWNNPLMAAGKNTFIDNMMDYCGLENSFTENTSRYPETSLEELVTLRPELILLSSEPFPFKEKQLREISEACPASKVLLADGQLFSWYGFRLLKAPEYFEALAKKF